MTHDSRCRDHHKYRLCGDKGRILSPRSSEGGRTEVCASSTTWEGVCRSDVADIGPEALHRPWSPRTFSDRSPSAASEIYNGAGLPLPSIVHLGFLTSLDFEGRLSLGSGELKAEGGDGVATPRVFTGTVADDLGARRLCAAYPKERFRDCA